MRSGLSVGPPGTTHGIRRRCKNGTGARTFLSAATCPLPPRNIPVHFGHDRNPQADKNVRAPITRVAPGPPSIDTKLVPPKLTPRMRNATSITSPLRLTPSALCVDVRHLPM
jgi:hypothetical protein